MQTLASVTLVRMYAFTCEFCKKNFESPSRRARFCSRPCHHRMQAAHVNETRQLTPTEAAYLAGLIDGEGTIVLQDRRGKGRPRALRPQVTLGVCGGSEAMHAWIEQAVGAGKHRTMQVSATALIKSNHPVYQWRLSAGTAVAVLRQVVPYMVEKRERALFAIQCHDEGFGPFDAAGGVVPSGAKFSG